jgi:Tol biopolymer transport system component
MSTGNWERLRALFDGALERPPHERASFLKEQGNGDEALRREVESLLRAHEAAGQFLETPALAHPDVPAGSTESASRGTRLAPGMRVGAFEILEVLGTGGMAEVYRARDTRLDRFVAIKVLSSEIDTAPGARERFEREGRAISRLSHPHVCAVYDVGTAHIDGRDLPFLVMELLDGETLAARIGRGALTIEQSLTYAIDIADALIAAHGQGIVHRDLKPANVMVTGSGVKLLDFGLAQLRAPEGVAAPVAGVPSVAALSSAGLVFGTLPYMSPEQLRGEKSDARTDIFAFGVLLHEMLTGIRPFAADSHAALIATILEHDPPPVSDRQPLAPASLDRIVQKCVAKDPDDRWQTARDLKSELIWVREGRTGVRGARTSAVEAPRRRSWRQGIAVAVPTIAALALAIALWRALAAPTPSRPVTHLSLTLPPGITLGIPINGTSIAIAPDGGRIAFLGDNQQGERSLFIHSLDTGKTASVPDTRGASNPNFSADSQWVAFFAQGEIKQVPAGGGPVQVVGRPGFGGVITWLSDGRFVRGNAAGQPLKQVLVDEGPVTRLLEGEEGHLTPLLVDDGSLLFTSLRGGMLSSSNSISVLRPNVADHSQDVVEISAATEVVSNATSPQLVGPDALAFARGRSLYAAGFDRQAVRLTSEPRAMGIDAQTTLLQAGPMYAVARNGTLVYAPHPGGRRLVWVDRSGREEFVNVPERMFSQFRLSPDGTRVAAYALDGDRDLWVIGLDGSSGPKLASGGMPVWSPDARAIYFTTGQRNIYRVPADGSTAPQTIFRLPPPDRLFATSITRDGKRLLTHWDLSPITPRVELRMLELGPAPELTRVVAESGVQSDGQLSHDGRWVAYSAAETLAGQRQVLVRPFPETTTRKWSVSRGTGYQPIWSHNGREIFYRTDDGTVMSVSVSRGPTPFDLELGKPVRVVTPVNVLRDWASGPTYDVSPDGQRFLFIKAPELEIRSLNVILNWDVQVHAALAGTGVPTR